MAIHLRCRVKGFDGENSKIICEFEVGGERVKYHLSKAQYEVAGAASAQPDEPEPKKKVAAIALCGLS